MKKKKTNDGELLNLLQQVLPKAIDDPVLVKRVYEAVEDVIKRNTQADAFEKFCERCELPDLEPTSVKEIRDQFETAFGKGNVTVTPDEEEKAVSVEVVLPDRTVTSQVKVKTGSEEASEEQEIAFKFVPFPVSLPGDQELVWVLGRRETMTPEEGGIALSKLQEDFWESKTGQNLLRKRVERTFPEFIARVPAGALSELGLKRHYKQPEPVKVLNLGLAVADSAKA